MAALNIPVFAALGTDAARAGVTFAEGRLVFTNDLHQFFVGDGATVGGILIGPGASDFVSLSDTPATLGAAGTVSRVNGAGTALEFAALGGGDIVNTPAGNLAATNVQTALDELQGDIDALNGAQNFLALNDTPAAFAANQYLQVNAGATALTFDTIPASDIVNTPSGNLAATNLQTAVDELQSDIDLLVGGVSYVGAWDAATDTPALPAAAAANKGNYYVVNNPGTTPKDGITSWTIGDWIISNGTAWQKVDNTDQVTSAFGRQGAVVAVAGDYTAAQITNTPAGNLAGATVQAALDELQTELDGAVQETRTITAGTGLTGGGDLTTNKTIDWAPASVTTENVIDNATDWIFFHDDSAGGPRKTLAQNFTTAIGAALLIRTLTAGSGLSGGGDLSADRTFDLDINGLGNIGPDPATDELAFYDTSGTTNAKTTFNTLLGTASISALSDVPVLGTASQILQVNAGATALEYATLPTGVTTWLGLTDTPNAYTGLGGNLVRVNAGATAVETFNGTTVFEAVANKGSANGYASLDAGGTVPQAQLPPIAITNVTVVADDTARNALTVQTGDVAIVTASAANSGLGATYAYDGTTWQRIIDPATASTWLGNTDTPAAYVASNYTRVNAGATALEFISAIPATDIANTAAGNLTGTTQQAVNNELQGDIDTINASLATAVQQTRTLTGGDGIAAIGDLSADRTVDLSLTEIVTEATFDAANDFIPFVDTSAASANRKVTGANLIAGLAVVQTTRTLTGGIGIAALGDLSADRTINLDINELATAATIDAPNDFFVAYDTSGTSHVKLSIDSIGGGSF
ncbi:MAG: beta strand repeat-containing protein [Gammaproteobacteria bacterium]